MGYHQTKIPRGQLGHFSKITEEYLELLDAHEQDNPILQLCECADLIGAIESFVKNSCGLDLADVIKMKDSTKSAFLDGTRVASTTKNADD